VLLQFVLSLDLKNISKQNESLASCVFPPRLLGVGQQIW